MPLAGVTLFAVGALFYLLVPLVAPVIPPQFTNAALFRPWAGWTSMYMILHPFGFGVVFAAVYIALLKRGAWTGAGGEDSCTAWACLWSAACRCTC